MEIQHLNLINVAQINCARSRIATIEATAHALQQNIDILIISEPYTFIHNNSYRLEGIRPSTRTGGIVACHYIATSTTSMIGNQTFNCNYGFQSCIIILNKNLTCLVKTQFTNPYCVTIEINEHHTNTNIQVISVYFPPTWPDDSVNDVLHNIIIPSIQTNPLTLVAGDFNARSVLWGDHLTNPRGDLIEDLLISFCKLHPIYNYSSLDQHLNDIIRVGNEHSIHNRNSFLLDEDDDSAVENESLDENLLNADSNSTDIMSTKRYTFSTTQGFSCPDITFVTPTLINFIRNWEINSDIFPRDILTGVDHNPIFYNIDLTSITDHIPNSSSITNPNSNINFKRIEPIKISMILNKFIASKQLLRFLNSNVLEKHRLLPTTSEIDTVIAQLNEFSEILYKKYIQKQQYTNNSSNKNSHPPTKIATSACKHLLDWLTPTALRHRSNIKCLRRLLSRLKAKFHKISSINTFDISLPVNYHSINLLLSLQSKIDGIENNLQHINKIYKKYVKQTKRKQLTANISAQLEEGPWNLAYKIAANKIKNKLQLGTLKQTTTSFQDTMKLIVDELMPNEDIGSDVPDIHKPIRDQYNLIKTVSNCNRRFANQRSVNCTACYGNNDVEQGHFETHELCNFHKYNLIPDDVSQAINQIPNKIKAPGIDGMHNKTCKIVSYQMVHLLTNLFNSCINLSYFPDYWKTGNLVIFIKDTKKDPSKPNSYRPITLLCEYSKLFERCLLNKLYSILPEETIFSPRQFGFRTGRSTVDAINEFIDYTHIPGGPYKLLPSRKTKATAYFNSRKQYYRVGRSPLYGKLQCQCCGTFTCDKSLPVKNFFTLPTSPILTPPTMELIYTNSRLRHTAIIFIDISGAFNTILWSRTIYLMTIKKLPKAFINIMTSYLDEKRNVVFELNQNNKYKRHLNMGCSQGSVIGPFLWNIVMDELLLDYNNFLPAIDNPTEAQYQVFAYADDLTIVVKASNCTKLEQMANSLLSAVAKWAQSNKLSISKEKTKAMLLGNSLGGRLPTFKIEHEPFSPVSATTLQKISFVNEYTYLGVLIDSKCLFNTHLSKTVDKAKQIFVRMSYLCSNILQSEQTTNLHKIRQHILLIYRCAAVPIISYASSVFKHKIFNKTSIQITNRLQKFCLSFAFTTHRSISCNALEVILRFPPLWLTVLKKRSVRKFVLPENVTYKML